ncbi:MAG: hypothetical protein PHF84_12380, partial [bacterium]|nr:hypothetical protein [bacterium]
MINQFKQYYLKSFLYYFFIVWNFLIIILLLLLNFYSMPFFIKKPVEVKKSEALKMQIKLVWESRNEYQNIDPDIFWTDCVDANRDKVKDIAALSHQGNMLILDGETGKILTRVSVSSTYSRPAVIRNHILAGNEKGEVHIFSVLGQLMKKLVITNSRVLDIDNGLIELSTGIYSVDPVRFKISKSFTYFSNDLIGRIASDRFNDDAPSDYVICEKNSIHCFDGLVLKQLWQKDVPFI